MALVNNNVFFCSSIVTNVPHYHKILIIEETVEWKKDEAEIRGSFLYFLVDFFINLKLS